jgi:hypothetical protein
MILPINDGASEIAAGERTGHMELFTIVALVTGAFAILGILADGFGVDSRPTMQDDWRRAW